MDFSKIDYPYYSYEYTLNKMKLKKLVKDFDPIIYTEIPPEYKRFHFEKYENKYFIIKEDDWKKNEEINNITDIFSEKVFSGLILGFSKFGHFFCPFLTSRFQT
jgi:hypothetical protein